MNLFGRAKPARANRSNFLLSDIPLAGQTYGCCCGCIASCCEDLNLDGTTFNNTGLGPGLLGCPDQPLCRTAPCYTGWTMDPGTISILEEIAGERVCAGFVTTGTYETNGLIGPYEWQAVVLCVGNGLAYKAFIKYTLSQNTGLIPEGVWIETEAGWECPDCGAIGTGNFADAVFWFDVLVDCTVCNVADYVYGPPDGCSPDTLYSVRYYWTGQGTCL